MKFNFSTKYLGLFSILSFNYADSSKFWQSKLFRTNGFLEIENVNFSPQDQGFSWNRVFTFHVNGRESGDGGSDGPDVGQLGQVRKLLGSQREDGGPETKHKQRFVLSPLQILIKFFVQNVSQFCIHPLFSILIIHQNFNIFNPNLLWKSSREILDRGSLNFCYWKFNFFVCLRRKTNSFSDQTFLPILWKLNNLNVKYPYNFT